ncbi:D-alanyl-D-alanine carboxypeptidase family protein [Ralstonia pseudosolanacearum]|uniref:D-alanyl-D-alanine carboxypeptidase family protein n=1 Tax=Ralstonia pseudosolanacearum TaxID=1310165 RepID=UPI001865A4A4|nr:D-alanyl-D-alanine carboxypeptidase family protein [Ralstonia pseudosolanacearum]MDN3369087.1 D-alanyl-D-alanine carboxypeptidase family protein [Ralstonia pseudosolanacearum]QOK89648.1 hypothetical protein HF907_24230 [Ralstonia pseudosolanacearum]
MGFFFSHAAFADEPLGCPAGRHCTIPSYKVGFFPPDSAGWTAGQYDSFEQACSAGNGLIAGKEVYDGVHGTPNVVPAGTWLDMHQSNCQYDSGNNACICDETLVEVDYTHKAQSQSLGSYAVCPANTIIIRPIANTDLCVFPQTPQTQTCPVATLTPITDPVALQHENGQYSGGHPDLDHLTQATRDGTSCIVQHALAQAPGTNVHPTSGFRPPAYQRHIREVWDKWQQLQNNTNPACSSLKAAVHTEWMKHGPFAHQPGATSNHSSGNAVDIGGVPQGNADAIASQCNMRRPVSNDRVHYEPN